MTARIVPVLIALVLVLSGCLVGHRTSAPDSDGDGLPDIVETEGWNLTITRTIHPCFGEPVPPINVTTIHVTSNPLREDTDNDGVSDFNEFYFHGNPNATDTTGGGIPDGEKWQLKNSGTYFASGNLALNDTDTDHDCLSDFQEIRGLDIPGIGHRTSDPTIADSDHDGFTDAWEFKRSHTDPLNPDTDGDGARDRFDADPLHDLWLTWHLDEILVKKTPDDAPATLQLIWAIPAHDPGLGIHRGAGIHVQEGQAATLPSSEQPGTFDMEDNQGGPTVKLSLSSIFIDDAGRAKANFDLNPFNPGAEVAIHLDVSKGTWSFDQANGTLTPPGNQRVLETPSGKLTFTLQVLTSKPT